MRRLKDVCFRTKNGSLVAFGATKTKAQCTRADKQRLFRKDVRKDELASLNALDGSGYTPKVLGYSRVGSSRTRQPKYRVYMEHTGKSLYDLPLSTYMRIRPRLLRWLPRAIKALHEHNVLHRDLRNGAKRNITYDHELGFRIIDFGLVAFKSYSVEREVAAISKHL